MPFIRFLFRYVGQKLADGVQKIAQTHHVGGADRHRVTETELIKLVDPFGL